MTTIGERQLYFAGSPDVYARVVSTVDILRSLSEHLAAAPNASRRTAVRDSALRDVSLADILRAAHVSIFDGTSGLVGVHIVIRDALEEFGESRQIVAAILEVQEEIPQHIRAVAVASLGLRSSLQSLVHTTCLFGLREDVFDGLGLNAGVPYRRYRLDCVIRPHPTLTDDQVRLAAVLTRNWTGSLASLMQTVRTLCPNSSPTSVQAPS